MQIEQTLHGYDDGHRLLASSLHLELEEERSLDLLSDLSGYLPTDTDFFEYDTGYPCGRFYVFARTWPDRAGKRSGTVFTHSLLIPRNACSDLVSLAALTPLFRQPFHPVDRGAYRQSIGWWQGNAPEPFLPSPARRLLAALWFGQDARPLLWTDPDTASDAAHLLWAWLPPWLRSSHAFCTFALQPRYLGQQLFDWLALARGAEGLFYAIRDRTIRCDGQTPPPGTGSLLELPWVAEIAQEDVAQIQSIWKEAIYYGLPPLPATELRVFLRYREFRSRSETNLTAALSRIDLLRRLAPRPSDATTEKSLAVWTYLSHARAVPRGERNLLVALELIERDPRSFAPALSADIGSFLAETLEARAADQQELAVRVLLTAKQMGFVEPAREGILDALRRTDEDPAAEGWLGRFGALADVLMEEVPGMVPVLLRAVPTSSRAKLVEQWFQRTSVDRSEAMVPTLLAMAEHLDDLALVAVLLPFVPHRSLLNAADAILARTATSEPDTLRRIVSSAGAEEVARWVTDRVTDPPLPMAFVDAIVAMLPDPSTATAFFTRTLPNTEAIVVLAGYMARHTEYDALPLLSAHPETRAILLRFAKSDPLRSGLDRLVPSALSDAEPSTLLATFDPMRSEQWHRAPWASLVIRRLLPALLESYLSGMVSNDILHSWLALGPCQAWLRNSDPTPIIDQLKGAQGEAVPRAMAVLCDPAAEPLHQISHPLRDCLLAWGEQRAADIAPVVPAWVAFMRTISDPERRAAACAITLRIALDKRAPALAPLAEVSFATAHGELLQDASFGWVVANFFLSLFGADWDRARKLREELTRVWLNEDWPPLSLLRAAGGDEQLFVDLVQSVKDRSGGKKALRRLWDAALHAPERDPVWDQLLAHLPRSVREK